MNNEQFFDWVRDQVREANEMKSLTTCKLAHKYWQGKINAFEAVLAKQGYSHG